MSLLQKSILTGAFILFVGTAALPADAFQHTSFETKQKALLVRIDASLTAMNITLSKVKAVSNITDATKSSATATFSDIISDLNSFKTRTQAATTVTEIDAIGAEYNAYITETRPVVKTTIQQIIADLSTVAKSKVEKLIKQVEQTLEVLKKTCPEEKDTIIALESQIDQLEKELAELKAAITAKDSAAMQQQVKESTVLAKAMSVNIKEIEANCL